MSGGRVTAVTQKRDRKGKQAAIKPQEESGAQRASVLRANRAPRSARMARRDTLKRAA